MNERKRFYKKVIIPDDPKACWGWKGKIEKVTDKGKGGYVVIRAFGKATRLHRLSWLLHRGEIPPGMEVAHHCDVRHCSNPDHLFLATHAENMADMAAKGRHGGPKVCGEQNYACKLTEADILTIRAARWTTGETQVALAKRYGVTQACISHIINRKTWKHVPEPTHSDATA